MVEISKKYQPKHVLNWVTYKAPQDTDHVSRQCSIGLSDHQNMGNDKNEVQTRISKSLNIEMLTIWKLKIYLEEEISAKYYTNTF